MNNKDEQHREEREESPSHAEQTVSDDDEIDYSVKPEFYDSELDNKDELWVQKKRGGRTSDAILNCPACFTTLCLDCQRHEKNVTQYRAMFVVNCKIKSEQVAQLGNKRKDVDLVRLKRFLIWAKHLNMYAVQFVRRMLESSMKKRSIISLTLFLVSLDTFLRNGLKLSG